MYHYAVISGEASSRKTATIRTYRGEEGALQKSIRLSQGMKDL